MKPGSKVIGLAVGQKSFLLAEVAPRGGRPAVQHIAEFPFPEGLSMATPEKLGQALGQLLRTRQFSTRDVVIGLPAKRLVTRRKEVPAANLAVASATLRLQAEGEFSSELDNLVLDFAGTTSHSRPSTVLLVATNRDIVDQCTTMARAAGLKVKGITATTAALGRATSRLPGGDGLVLNLGQAGAELVIQHGENPAHLRHLTPLDSASPEAIGALAGEIRRTVASLPRNGTPMTLAVWGAASNGEIAAGNLLEQRLSMPVTTPELRSLVSAETPNIQAYAAPVAVALSALEPAGMPVDFLHSRLAAPAKPKVSREKKLAIGAIVLAVLLVGGAYAHISIKQNQADQLQAELDRNAATVKEAKLEAKRLADAQAWIPRGPHFVSVLRDVTALFPRQGNTIWATQLTSLRDRNNWELDGKCSSEQEARSLVDVMLSSPRFARAKLTYLQQEPTTRLYSFRLQFTYVPE